MHFASSRFTHSPAHEDPDALPYQPVIVRNREEALKTTCDGFYFGSESPTEQSELTRRYGRGRCYSSQNKIRIVQLVARFA